MWAYVRQWRNTVTLYRHAAHVDPDNDFAHSALACYFAYVGEHEKALPHSRRAVVIRPASPVYRLQLGKLLCATERYTEAVSCLERLVRFSPGSVEGRQALALARKRLEETRRDLVPRPQSKSQTEPPR